MFSVEYEVFSDVSTQRIVAVLMVYLFSIVLKNIKIKTKTNLVFVFTIKAKCRSIRFLSNTREQFMIRQRNRFIRIR